MNPNIHTNGTGQNAQTQQGPDYGGTRMILPPADIGRSIVTFDIDKLDLHFPVDLRHLYYAVTAGLPTFGIGALATPNTLAALGAASGAGLLAGVASSRVDRTKDTPISLTQSWLRKHSLRRAFPLDSDEVLSYWTGGVPIHGIKRIYDDGTIEMWDGRCVAFIGMHGPNTENESPHATQSKVEGLSAGIRSDVEGDFSWYMTTSEEMVDNFVEKYRDAVYSEQFAGEEFELVREYLHDKIDYESAVEPGRWRTRELLTYAVVEVSPSEVQSASAAALSQVDKLREAMPGMSRSQSITEHKSAISRQLKQRLDARVEGMTGALTSTPGVEVSDVYRAGPTEVAMLASDYWGGTPIDKNVAESAPAVANLAVWPSIDEAADGEGPVSHRPTPVERQLEREYSEDPSDVEELIAGIERVDALSDDSSVRATRNLQSTAASEAGTAEDVFGDNDNDSDSDSDSISERDSEEDTAQEIASYSARLREYLLGDSGYEVEAGESNLSPEQTAIAPTRFDIDEDGEYLVVGDEYVKTFWLTGWTPTPTPNLLEGLKRHERLHPDSNSRANDATFNLCIRVQDVSRGDAKEFLRRARNKLGIEIADDPDEISTQSLDSVADYYRAMSFLLETSNSIKPWRVNGYVTIRAGTKQGIDEAKRQLEQGYASEDGATVSLGKREAVEDTAEAVFSALRSASPGLIIRDEPGHIDTLFKSGFPASTDLYNQTTSVERTQLCLTGAVGAMLPFAEKVPQESNGAEWGRHRATGLKMYADYFSRGKAPHGIGIGDSGSSKTFSKGMQYLQWYLADTDRTVVACDTMGGFKQFMELLGPYANHIRVDGSTTINPFSISAVTGSTRGEDVTPGEMTFESSKEWLLEEVKNQGGNPDDFNQTVEQLITLMYQRHGIDINDPSTFDNGNPNMVDFIETMDYLEENPEEATLGSSGSEVADIVSEVKSLKRNLAGFSKLGRNSHMMGESDVSLEPCKFNWLDLEAVESSSGGAGKSAMLQLMLKQVYELVKKAPKETVFLVDEAHILLRTDWSLKLLSTGGVHWRHFEGRIDAITHRPGEVISGPEDPDELKDRFRSQASTTEFWNVESFKREHAKEFFTDEEGNFNEQHYQYVKNQAVTGESDKPFSTSMVQFHDLDGWYTNHIRTGPIVTAFHSWKEDKHGPFKPFFRYVIDHVGEYDTIAQLLDEYERMYLAGDVPSNEYIDWDRHAEVGFTDQSPQNVPAATDGGSNENQGRKRDSQGRFVEEGTGGDD